MKMSLFILDSIYSLKYYRYALVTFLVFGMHILIYQVVWRIHSHVFICLHFFFLFTYVKAIFAPIYFCVNVFNKLSDVFALSGAERLSRKIQKQYFQSTIVF